MDTLLHIGVFIVVLGELVFFHELGHFLAAKACGIYCERFSLGMPPRVIGFKFGETDYCLGLLPIGGYVKMAGQEDVPLTEEERQKEYGNVPRERWFMNKPVWQRIIVIVAGPLMNIVLALALYATFAAVGDKVPESKVDNRIGIVEPDSPAASAPLYAVAAPMIEIPADRKPDATGWQTGDRVLSIDGDPVTNVLQDVLIDAVLSGGKQVRVEIERTGPDGNKTRYLSPVVPRIMPGEDHPRFGVAQFSTALVDSVLADSPAEAAGIKPGDEISRLNGQIVDAGALTKTITEMTSGQTTKLDIRRGNKSIQIVAKPEIDGEFKDIAFYPSPKWLTLSFDDQKLVVEKDEPTARQTPQLHPGDTITEIDGASANCGLLKRLQHEHKTGPSTLTVASGGGLFGFWSSSTRKVDGITLDQILEAITPFALSAHPTIAGISDELHAQTQLQRKDVVEQVAVLPPGTAFSTSLKLDFAAATTALLGQLANDHPNSTVVLKVHKPAILWGLYRGESDLVAPLQVSAVGRLGVTFKEKEVFRRFTAAEVLPEAIRLSIQAIKRTILTVQRLVTGGVSARDLGGPLMIYMVTTHALQEGYLWLLEMTAFISINLAVFNLLPLPVLDGGHLLFLTIEGVRRKPVSAKVMEWVQQVGLIFIIGLMLYVTFNDVRRFLENTILP